MIGLLFAAAAGLDIDAAATAIVDALVHGRSADLADGIAIHVSTDRSDVDRTLARLILARVSSAGARDVVILESAGGGDAAARELGAEWMIAVRGAKEGSDMALAAELRAIDRGVWEPALDVTPILATARARFSIGAPIPEPPPPAASDEGVRLLGPPVAILSVDAPVLAIAACALTGGPGDDLVLLLPSAVEIYAIDRARPRAKAVRWAGRFDLAPLAPARRPSRDAIGAIACFEANGPAAFAFGHSGLGRGHVLRARKTGGGLDLEAGAILSGMPVASVSADRWLLAETIDGTNRIRLLLGDTASAALYDAARIGDRTVALTLDYRVVELGPKLEERAVLGSSGVGLSGFTSNGQIYVVTTDNRPGESDQITVLSSIGDRRKETNPIAIREGRVHATAVGRFFDGRETIAAAARSGSGSTDILAIDIEAP